MEIEEELFSECCGAYAGLYEDIGICPECREHCEWRDEGSEDESQWYWKETKEEDNDE